MGCLVSPVTPGAPPGFTLATPPSFAVYLLSSLIFSSVLITGEAEGYSLAAAKDASRFVSASTAVPSKFEVHQSDYRGNKGLIHHGRILEEHETTKHHGQRPHQDSSLPSPDFERQLEELKENTTSAPTTSKPQPSPVIDEDVPISPQSRKDVLFTPGLGVEEVSFLGPIRRPSEGDEDSEELTEARPLDLPLKPDLLESEADVLEELRKLNGRHDAPDPLLQELTVLQTTPTPPQQKYEEARILGIGGGTGDHFGIEEEDEEDGDEEDTDDEDVDMEKGGIEESEDEDEDDEDDDEDNDEEGEEEVTRDPAKDIASLEERLSASLRELAERRRQSQKTKFASTGEYIPVSSSGGYSPHSAPDRPGTGPGTGFSGPGTAPETASGSAPGTAPGTPGETLPGTYPGPPRTDRLGEEDITSSAPISSPEMVSGSDDNVEKGNQDTRTIMKKAHMARKLMDPEDPKKDEDLLELMLRIAENPDEWKRVHHLLRQLDDDLTTYEKTMHRVEALAVEKSSEKEGDKKGRRKKPGDKGEEDPELRRQELSKSGLPAGSHGEELTSTTTTTQLPLHPSAVGTSATTHHGNHKDWPRFAYHRVTTAPQPDLFLQQHEKQKEGSGSAPSSTHPGNLHRNAYIAVSIITPPKGRHGGSSRPIPSPPPVYAVSPTPSESLYDRSQMDSSQIQTIRPPADPRTTFIEGERIAEETLREPMAEEDIVDDVARGVMRGRHHKTHADPVEEQLRTLAAVEEKLRHHLHEKERMRHLLEEAGKVGDDAKHHRRERSTQKSTNVRHHHQNGLIASKTS